MKSTSFTFIMPVYNTKEEYLRFALDSIFNQNYDNYEVIIVDDGSNENTKIFLNNYEDKVSIIHQKNTGMCKARINAFKYIKNDYVIFMDSDDYLKEGSLKLLDNLIKKYSTDIVLYDFARFKNNDVINYYSKQQFMSEGIKTREEILTQLCSFHLNSICSKIIKKDLLEGLEDNINIDIRNGDDLQQSTYLLLKAKSYYYTEEIIQLYRVLDEQRTYYNINNITRDINWLVRPLEMLKDAKIDNKYINMFYTSSVNNIIFNAFRICLLAQNKKERDALLIKLKNTEAFKLIINKADNLPIHLNILQKIISTNNYNLVSFCAKLYDIVFKMQRF